MTPERIKEIHSLTAYPESISVRQALLQVWNECEQDNKELRGEVERLKGLINTVAGDFFAAGLRRAKSKNPETLNLVDYKEYYFKQNNILGNGK